MESAGQEIGQDTLLKFRLSCDNMSPWPYCSQEWPDPLLLGQRIALSIHKEKFRGPFLFNQQEKWDDKSVGKNPTL